MRIRIALATAVAVIAIPAIFFAVFSGTPAASARVTRHEAISQHRAVKIDFKPMSYTQARKVATMVNYANAVEAGKVDTYLTEVAYLKAVAAQNQQAAQAQAAALATAAANAAAAQARAVAAATPVPAASGGGSDATSTDTPDWTCIRQHESNGNYAEGNGGAYQFELGTWTALTGLPAPAEDYPSAVQDAAALKLYSQRGWEPWTTRYVCGL